MASGDSWEFEKILDQKESTNFDFFYRTTDRAHALFEIKLSEGGFGTTKGHGHQGAKLSQTYRPCLSGRVDPALLEPKKFFASYQLCRNFSYVRNPGDHLFIVYPKANTALTAELNVFLELVNAEQRGQVKPVHLETLVPRILKLLPVNAVRLQQHYREFTAKYLMPE